MIPCSEYWVCGKYKRSLGVQASTPVFVVVYSAEYSRNTRVTHRSAALTD